MFTKKIITDKYLKVKRNAYTCRLNKPPCPLQPKFHYYATSISQKASFSTSFKTMSYHIVSSKGVMMGLKLFVSLPSVVPSFLCH